MFHKTSLRLTCMYLAIVMAISLSFSMTLYNLSMREFDRGFRRQDELIARLSINQLFPQSFQHGFIQIRQTAAEEAKQRILTELWLANVAIFIVGGGLSYFLARRTLIPIEEAHEALEQFTADASHELRTPIAAMRSEIEVALMQPKLSNLDAKQVLQSNLEELDRLTQLTDGLLSIARLEEGLINIVEQPVMPLVQEAIKKVSTASKQKKVSFVVEPGKTDLRVLADKAGLLESLVIILDNAVKYSSSDATIEVKVYRRKDKVFVGVTDHGMGIKPKDLPHVFDRFYRADSSRSQQDKTGHGLGLAIAKQLLERQNAEIKLTSKPGVFTTAVIAVPGVGFVADSDTVSN